MNLNPNKYSSAIVKTALYKCGLSPNLLFYDHGENKWKNYPECRAGAWNFCPVVPPRMATACTNESSSHHWSIYNWSSFPYTFPMSRAVKIIGSHSYHLTTRLSSTFCGFEMVVLKQWWFQDFPYLWASVPRQVDLVKSDQSDDTSGGSGGMLPGKIFEFRVSEMAFPALWGWWLHAGFPAQVGHHSPTAGPGLPDGSRGWARWAIAHPLELLLFPKRKIRGKIIIHHIYSANPYRP